MITLTDAAATYIRALLTKKGDHAEFRLSLKKTGCSGYSYAPNVIAQLNDNDICVETDKGLKIYLDSRYTDYLKGLVIDYRDENTMGLKQKRLVFINPNEESRCGCGESFNIEK
ncbi:MAG: hypothetical protein A3F11_03435 [Gammaproteobacteria bacterium RIFCSPHIGHO2_12_FULL_37_14]|nr:MAG: hypothetical protein A3F11_03435 [Gammaproteobacteria bacterium RIFCSPHIGHO2_12_FULL_37_14]